MQIAEAEINEVSQFAVRLGKISSFVPDDFSLHSLPDVLMI
jgi:hypothetical protein